MSVRIIEREVIASCLSEEKYPKCSFLQPSDFQHYGEVWGFIQKHKGNFVEILMNFHAIENYCITLFNVSMWKPERLALKILEISFQRSLLNLMSSLQGDELELLKVSELQSEVVDLDILGVVDSLPEYAKLTLNQRNSKKIEGWSNNCKKRIDGVKAVY